MGGHTLASIARQCPDDIRTYYADIRALGGDRGCFIDADLGAVVITDYREAIRALESGALAKSRIDLSAVAGHDELVRFVSRVFGAQTMFSDGEDAHEARLAWSRRLAKSIELRSNASLAEEWLGRVPHDSEFDLFSDLLAPYVSSAVFRLLDLPIADKMRLAPYISAYVRFLDGRVATQRDVIECLLAVPQLYASVGQSVPSTMQGEARHVAISNLILVLAAGHESTAYALATVVLELGQSLPSVLGSASDPELRAILSEALRYDSPVQLIGRRVVAPSTVCGLDLRLGDRVFVHVGAANRDPREFDAADEYQWARSGPPPLSFGWGRTQCLGRSASVALGVEFLRALGAKAKVVRLSARNGRRDCGISGRTFARLPAMLGNGLAW